MNAHPREVTVPAAAPARKPWTFVHVPDAARRTAERLPPAGGWLGRLLRNRTGLFALAFLLLICAVSASAPVIYPGNPFAMVARPMQWPGQDLRYPLGTDALGRDVLAGLIHGGRVSLIVGLSATLIGTALGLLVGALAGYFGGKVDAVLSRLIEIFQTMPSFVLLIVLVAITETSIAMVTIAIGLINWPTIAPLARSEFRALRDSEFVVAARGLGFSHLRIIFSEILPNAIPPITVTASMLVASAILMESALSFLGFGDPNVISWGTMIGTGREFVRTAWYLAALPGVAIMLTVISINLLGDALNDALNPRLKGAS